MLIDLQTIYHTIFSNMTIQEANFEGVYSVKKWFLPLPTVPYFIYQEYIANGNLRDLLQTSYQPQRELNSTDKGNDSGLQHPIVFSKEIADALAFLHCNQVP